MLILIMKSSERIRTGDQKERGSKLHVLVHTAPGKRQQSAIPASLRHAEVDGTCRTKAQFMEALQLQPVGG